MQQYLLRAAIIVAAAILGAAIGLQIKQSFYQVPQQSSASAKAKVAPSLTPSPSPSPEAAYPLAISEQISRNYPGSKITIVEAPAPRAGFRSGVISYMSDGLRIYASVVLPEAPAPEGGYPAIIFDHGYVQPAAYTTANQFYGDFASAFAKEGFVVVLPDLRGHGMSWGVPEGAYFSPGYVADTLNLATSLKQYAPVNASQISLMGHSMGGRVALVSAIVRPTAFKALVIAAGSVGEQTDMYGNWQAFSDFGDPVTLGIRARVINLFGPPTSSNAFWKDADPYTHLSKLTVPTLLAQDPNDDTVPYRFSQALEAAIKKANQPVTLREYNGGHSFDGASRAAFTTDASTFIKARLKDKFQPAD